MKRVSLAWFSRLSSDVNVAGASLIRALSVVLAVTLPMCVLLGVYAAPLIEVFFGSKWSPAASVLSWLCVLSAVRLIVDLGYDYLVAMGRTKLNLVLQVVWLVALIPALVVGARQGGIEGVAFGHAAVGVGVVLPLLAVLLARTHVSMTELVRALGRPVVGSLCIALTAVGVYWLDLPPFTTCAVGGVVGAAAYAIVVAPARKRLLDLSPTPAATTVS